MKDIKSKYFPSLNLLYIYIHQMPVELLFSVFKDTLAFALPVTVALISQLFRFCSATYGKSFSLCLLQAST